MLKYSRIILRWIRKRSQHLNAFSDFIRIYPCFVSMQKFNYIRRKYCLSVSWSEGRVIIIIFNFVYTSRQQKKKPIMQNLIMRAKTLFSNRLSDRLLWSVMWCVFWSSERTNGEDKISIMYIQLWHQFTYIVRRFQHERMIEFFVFIRKTSAIFSITGNGRRTDDRCHSVGRKQTFQFDCAEIRWGPIEHNSNTFIAGNPIANGRLTQLWKSHSIKPNFRIDDTQKCCYSQLI